MRVHFRNRHDIPHPPCPHLRTDRPKLKAISHSVLKCAKNGIHSSPTQLSLVGAGLSEVWGSKRTALVALL